MLFVLDGHFEVLPDNTGDMGRNEEIVWNRSGHDAAALIVEVDGAGTSVRVDDQLRDETH
jgi:hypothetical protein